MRAMFFAGMALVGLAIVAGPSMAAAPVLPPVSQRFALEGVTETPDFQRHVGPLLGRLGCNGRSCHGSFQGRGGFRLSLFGYDFAADHEELLKGDPPRVNRDKPLESLILVKPTDADLHEGGQRYKQGGWEYHVFRRWIEAGAKFDPAGVQKLVALEVTPSEILFSKPGEKVTLTAVAVWPDGTREDVTCLCRFTTNNDQVAAIDADGVVTAADPGDTHVVVAYDNAVIAVPVIRPVSQLTGDQYPPVPAPTAIDRLVVEKLRKLGVVPSDLCTDAEFLRRVSLDLTGTLPTAAEVEQFLADASPNKRAAKIDELLERPAYAAWWTTRLCDWTGNNDTKFNGLGPFRQAAAQQWYDWIYDRVARNVPYDQIVEGIVTAVSRQPDESYIAYCTAMSQMVRDAVDGTQRSFAQRSSLPFYWGRTGFRTAEERAIGFAYTFLGIRIQCAQCHKHPFDQWSKADFDAFKNFFGTVTVAQNGDRQRGAGSEYEQILKDLGLAGTELKGNQLTNRLQQLLREGKTVPFPEVVVQKTPAGRRGSPAVTARVLGGEAIDLSQVEDPRVPLMAWLRDPQNPYFARAFVNRVWANYFNVGIVQPPDDMSLGNPPSNGPLLDYLARGFIEHGFDMKWVHREICNSRTYQLSWQPNETNVRDERNFARAVPRRLPAEVAVDAVTMALASDERAASFAYDLTGRAIAIPGANARANQGANARDTGFALQVFGRSIRESNCDCDRSMEASLLQTVFLHNDQAVLQALEQPRSWIGQLTQAQAQRSEDETSRERQRLEAALRRAKRKGNPDEVRELESQLAGLKRPAGSGSGGLLADPPSLVRQAYLRTLSRYPTPEETQRCLVYLAQAESPAAGAKGLLWALINTKEFIVNH
jgi:hypothetical protein